MQCDKRIPVLLDTDIGSVSVTPCLSYLLTPQCELLGITTVSGDQRNAMLADAGVSRWQDWYSIIAAKDR